MLFGSFSLSQIMVSAEELTPEEQAEVDKKNDQLEELEKKEQSYTKIIDLKAKQEATLTSQLSQVNTEINKVTSTIKTNEEQIEDLNNQVTDLTNKINEKEELIIVQRKVLAELVRAYYEYNKQDVLNMLSDNSQSLHFMSEEDQLNQIGDGVQEMLENIRALKVGMEEEKNKISENKNEIINKTYQLEERNAYLESNRQEKNRLVAETLGDKARYQQRLDKVKEQQMEILREIEEIEYGKIDDVDFSKLPKAEDGYFSYPVKSVRITQGYGKTSFSSNYSSGKHNGIDFGVNNQSIYSVKSGKVLSTGDCGKYAYGKWVAINHGDGLVTLYGHLSKISVSKGENVGREEKIGTSGNTGFSTGPHLHFSVFAGNTFEIVNSKYVSGLKIPTGSSINPNNYLP